MSNNKSGFKPFLAFIKSTHIPKALLTFGILGTVISTLASLTIPVLTGEIVDSFSISTLSIGVIIAIIAAFIIQAGLDGISVYLLAKVGQKIVANSRKSLWGKIVRLPVTYFDKTSSGNTASRVVNDTGIVKDLISQYLPEFIGGVISILGAVTILFIMDWKMTLIMFISVPVTVLIMIPLGSKMTRVSRSLQDETAAFSGTIQQAMNENRLMKSSTAEKVEERKGVTGIEQLFQYGLKEARITAIISPLIYLIVMVVIVFIIGYGGVRVAEGSMSTGSLVAFLLYLFQIIYPITSFAMFFTQLQKAKGATERIIDILNLDEESMEEGLEIDISEKVLRFSEVNFGYDEYEPVLKNISFEAKPGEMIAFVGPSGSGKTTLFSLIERYYTPDSGNIYVGDTPIYAIALEHWRRQIGYVSQESTMMAGTIRDNLTYGLKDPTRKTDDELWKVLKMAYADTFIRSFHEGLETEVGERGVKLSGGQRQRINIARAFLRDPKILMLDEATASLDSQSEQVVQEALTHLMRGRTTLVIAHRLSTIVDADNIVFIDKGKITGIGTHDQLAQTHPLYQAFTEQQLT